MGKSVNRVRGTNDWYGDPMARMAALERKVRDMFPRWGYSEIQTPTLERTELFARGLGEHTDVVHKEMYTFEDRKGRSLTLRPENTAGVVRAYLTEGLRDKGHGRLFYIGDMYRYERPQKGRYRQFRQVGVEVLGEEGPLVEAESLAMLFAFLGELGLEGLSLDVNSVGDGACRPGFHQALTAYLADHRDSLCKDCTVRMEQNPMRVLDCKVPSCRPVIEKAPTLGQHLCDPCREHHKDLLHHLDILNIPYKENPLLVRGLDYYTRTAFEVKHGGLGSQDALLGGGRYDGLVEELGGPATPGFGYAMGVERILLAAEGFAPAGRRLAALIWSGEETRDRAVTLAQELRDGGLDLTMVLEAKSFKAQFKQADKRGARHALILGSDELARGEITLKDMAEGTQEVLPLKVDAILEKLKG